MKQKFIELPEAAARQIEIGDTIIVYGPEYEVKSIRFDEDGNKIELVRDDGKETTMELEEGVESSNDKEPEPVLDEGDFEDLKELREEVEKKLDSDLL